MTKIDFLNLNGAECEINEVVDLFGNDSIELQILEEMYTSGDLLPNHCAQNSELIMKELNEYYGYDKVKYIEGYAIDENNEKILHCWNVVEGKYFDATAEYFWDLPSYCFDYKAHRLFDETQLSYFHDVGGGLNVSMGEMPDKYGKYAYTFGDLGYKYSVKLTKKKLMKLIDEDIEFQMAFDYNCSNLCA